jgi:predicted dienelactone hydrolase
MRTFETLIAVTLLASLVTGHIPGIRRLKPVAILPLLAAAFIPLQMIIEGYRWQMVPLYLFTLLFCIIILIHRLRRSEEKNLIRIRAIRTALNILVFMVFLIASIFPILLPVKHLPEPGGPYGVGKISFRMEDNEREELFTEDPDDRRVLLVTLWYPAMDTRGKVRDRYWDREKVTGRTYSINADIGTFWYTHLSLVKTNSIPEATSAESENGFPVVVYSHSFYGMNTENTMLAEDLASNGYIFVSIAHSYENIISIFPDGNYITGSLDHISTLYDSHADQEQKYYDEYRDAKNWEQKVSLTKKILKVDDLSSQLLKIRTEDVVFVMDQLPELNSSEGLLQSSMNLEQVGIMGWSFGGATSMEACIADHRFKAGVNIDGIPYGELFNSGEKMAQPMMMIRARNGDEMEEIIGDLILESMENKAYLLKIENAQHANFWDFPFFFKIYTYFGYWGELDPLRLLEIERNYLRGFFDRYLKGMDAGPGLNPAGHFPEVTFNVVVGKHMQDF